MTYLIITIHIYFIPNQKVNNLSFMKGYLHPRSQMLLQLDLVWFKRLNKGV